MALTVRSIRSIVQYIADTHVDEVGNEEDDEAANQGYLAEIITVFGKTLIVSPSQETSQPEQFLAADQSTGDPADQRIRLQPICPVAWFGHVLNKRRRRNA